MIDLVISMRGDGGRSGTGSRKDNNHPRNIGVRATGGLGGGRQLCGESSHERSRGTTAGSCVTPGFVDNPTQFRRSGQWGPDTAAT